MKASPFVVLTILAVACTQSVERSGPSPGHASDTDRFCSNVEESKGTRPPRLFGSLQRDPTRQGTWQTYPAEVLLAEAVEAGEVYDYAYLWRSDRGTLVSLTLSSASGDWLHSLDYCFRADGSLAKSASTLNTFHSTTEPVSRERTRYFDGCGNQIGLRSRLLDLQTRKPVPEREAQFMDQDEPRIRRIDGMPFAGLLGAEVLTDKASTQTAGCASRS